MGIDELQSLLREKTFVAGLKQTRRSLEGKRAKMVIIASDADEPLRAELCAACPKQGVSHVSAFTMRELGECCDIDVGASVIAILETE